MRMKTPAVTPDAPKPAMARPTTSAVLFGARAHIMLPTSKMNSENRNVHFLGKYLKILPQV
ncbi:hypothetical protein GQ44DRAFT_711031, partial [Phaeosphaeriaceae sp. PMI808]